MRVDFFRTGGTSGVRLTTSLDTTRLFPDEAVKVHKLLDDANFFDLPENIQAARSNPDAFQYQITVDSAEHTHTVKVSDAALPPSLRPLIDYLSAQATRTRA